MFKYLGNFWDRFVDYQHETKIDECVGTLVSIARYQKLTKTVRYKDMSRDNSTWRVTVEKVD